MKMKLPLLMIAAVLGAVSIHAQTTTLAIDAPFFCGTYASPQRCFNLPVTVTDEQTGQPVGPSGAITVSYYPPGYYVGGSIRDYGYVQFKDDFLGLANPASDARITAVNADGDLLIDGIDDQGLPFAGVLSYTYTTKRITVCSGRGCAHSVWTITGGTLTIHRSAQ